MNRKISVAPMMDCTDRHERFFLRLISKNTLLYTEMIVDEAINRGDKKKLLEFNINEKPVALQLGGSSPKLLKEATKVGEDFGYDEINFNLGCPSRKVEKNRFGACLIKEPKLVADCLTTMQSATKLPVTIKTRIGYDNVEDYENLYKFISILKLTGIKTFIIHARKAMLGKFTPKQNLNIPPLKYDYVYQLKKDFPSINIIINGGIKTLKQIEFHLNFVDGVMIGREAYSNPYLMSVFDSKFYNDKNTPKTRPKIIEEMSSYILSQMQLEKVSINSITRHMYGLMSGVPGAKKFRQLLTGNSFLKKSDVSTLINMLYQITDDVV